MKDKCKVEGCDRDVTGRGLCLKHWKQAKRRGEFEVVKPVYDKKCVVDGCDTDQEKKGYCGKHYRRMQRNGHLETVRQAPGGRVKLNTGYLTRRVDGKPKLDHVLVAEEALGFELPRGVEVHHVNENPADNRPENLVVCQDRTYHKLLHMRQNALDACGNANWRKCPYCKQYDDPENMTERRNSGNRSNSFYHAACSAKAVREGKARRKALTG